MRCKVKTSPRGRSMQPTSFSNETQIVAKNHPLASKNCAGAFARKLNSRRQPPAVLLAFLAATTAAPRHHLGKMHGMCVTELADLLPATEAVSHDNGHG